MQLPRKYWRGELGDSQQGLQKKVSGQKVKQDNLLVSITVGKT